MYCTKIPNDGAQIAGILEQSIKLFRQTGMPELASKWERILKTYNTQKGKKPFHPDFPIKTSQNHPNYQMRF